MVQDFELFVNKLDPTKKFQFNTLILKTLFLLLFHYYFFVIQLNLNYYMLPHDHYCIQVLNENIVSQDKYQLYTIKTESLKHNNQKYSY